MKRLAVVKAVAKGVVEERAERVHVRVCVCVRHDRLSEAEELMLVRVWRNGPSECSASEWGRASASAEG